MENISHNKLTKIYFYCFLFLLIFSINTELGAIATDSISYIEKNIDKYPTIEKIDLLIELSKYHSKYNTKKSVDLLYKSLQLAYEIKDTVRIVDVEFTTGYIFQVSNSEKINTFDSAKVHYFNALTLLDYKEDKDQKYMIYIQLGDLHENINKTISFRYFEKALAIAEEIEYADNFQLYLAQRIAYITIKLDKYQQSILYSLKVIEILDRMKNEKDKISYLNYIGNSYYELGQFDKALSYYFQELELRRKYNVNPLNDDFLDKLAKVYTALEQYDKALEYYKRAFEIYNNQKNNRKDNKLLITAQYYSKIGLTYYYKTDYNNSMDYYSKALDIIEKLKDEESLKGKSIIYNNLALNYKAMGQIEKALQTIKKSEEIINKIGIDSYEFLTLTSFSEIYAKLNKFDEAEKYLLKAIERSKVEESTNDLKNSTYLLYQLYTKFNKFESALDTYKNYKNMTDSLINLEMTDKLVEFQTVYEMEKRNQENDDLKTANRLQKEKAELERQSFILTSLFSFMVIVVLMVLFYFRKRASNVLVVSNLTIEGQNARLLELNENLRKSESTLRHSNTTKDKFISIIAHDLKNPMHSIGFSADLMINYFDNLNDEKKIDHLKGIYKTSNHAYDLLENLLHWARAQSKSMTYEPEDIDLGLVIKDVVDLSFSSAENKKIYINNQIDYNNYVYADRNMIETVTRNLISNSIKFCNEGNTISISYLSINDYIVVVVNDDGIGIPDKTIDKIFKIEEQISTPGTMKETGTGLGLLLCKEFVNINRGDIWVESTYGKGATFKFTLPKTKKSKFVSKEIVQQKLRVIN